MTPSPPQRRRTMPLLALLAGVGLVLLESLNGNAISFWSAVGAILAILASFELLRRQNSGEL